MKIIQVRLQSTEGHTQTVWVDATLKLRPGYHVVGKDGRAWNVHAVYAHVMLDVDDLNYGWHVGGLL